MTKTILSTDVGQPIAAYTVNAVTAPLRQGVMEALGLVRNARGLTSDQEP